MVNSLPVTGPGVPETLPEAGGGVLNLVQAARASNSPMRITDVFIWAICTKFCDQDSWKNRKSNYLDSNSEYFKNQIFYKLRAGWGSAVGRVLWWYGGFWIFAVGNKVRRSTFAHPGWFILESFIGPNGVIAQILIRIQVGWKCAASFFDGVCHYHLKDTVLAPAEASRKKY